MCTCTYGCVYPRVFALVCVHDLFRGPSEVVSGSLAEGDVSK